MRLLLALGGEAMAVVHSTQPVAGSRCVSTLTTSELASQVAGGLGEGAQELGAVGTIPA